MNDGGELKLADFAEKTLVLYYYPKDSTPGCTTEANGFSASIEEFEKNNVTIIGVSGDNAKSHCNFIEKQGLKFKLATDEVTHLTATFGPGYSLECNILPCKVKCCTLMFHPLYFSGQKI